MRAIEEDCGSPGIDRAFTIVSQTSELRVSVKSTSSEASISKGRSDRIGVAARRNDLTRGDLSIDGESLGAPGPGAGYRVGANGISPVGGAPGVAVQTVFELRRIGAGHFAGSNRGSGCRASIETDVVGSGIGAGGSDGRSGVDLRTGISSKGKSRRRDGAGSRNHN
jgi:hypothetical protein